MSEKHPRVMVAGATGYIGGGVLQILHQKGFWIRALCRDKSRLRHPDWCDDIFVGHATQPETLMGLCEGIDVVFSSIGIRSFKRKPTVWEVDYQANLNILQEAKTAGVKHFIFVSVLHASEMARLSPIADARNRVAQAIIQSGMDYNIFAPTGFFNDSQEFLVAAQQKGVVRLFGDGSGVGNPLSALDFGKEIVKVIEDPKLRNQVRPVGGCEEFSHRQVAELAFQVIGKEPRVKTVPAWWLALQAFLLRPFNYNAYTVIKFFEFVARTPDMTGEPIGRRRLEDFFRNLAKGLSITEADSLCNSQPCQNSVRFRGSKTMISKEAEQQLRERFEQFAELREQHGTERALEMMMNGHAEVQKKLMEPLIRGAPLAEAFYKAIPIFEQLGMKMDVVDISNKGKDAVLEIQRICPYALLAKQFGLQTPCQITCDMDVEAIQQAFPQIQGRILSKLAQGDCVCLFKYERDANTGD